MLTVAPDPADGDQPVADNPASSSLIDEIVREGARRILAAALQAEVDAYIAQFANQRDDNGRRLVLLAISPGHQISPGNIPDGFICTGTPRGAQAAHHERYQGWYSAVATAT